MKLGKSDFFGERALLKNEPRAANVCALGSVDCLVLERADFVSLLGPLETILGREAERRGQVQWAGGVHTRSNAPPFPLDPAHCVVVFRKQHSRRALWSKALWVEPSARDIHTHLRRVESNNAGR